MSDIINNGQVKNEAQIRQFGLEVKRRRMDLGLTQEEFAGLSGLHRTYISGIERGDRNPTLDIILRLALALSCAPGDLLPRESI
jgi:transcriptional regulator with XRE-family HTH domain